MYLQTPLSYAAQQARPRWPALVREPAVEEGRAEPDAEPEGLEEAGLELIEEPSPNANPAATLDAEPDAELYLLGEECAEAYMQADALHYRAMVLLVQFHQRQGWHDTGFSSTAEWLAWRIGIKLGAARERLRTALALVHLPQTSQAMKNGELSFTKVRALTRVATPENEEALLDFAMAGSAAGLERVVRGWKTLDRKSELTAEQIRHRRRRFSAWVDDDGMVVVKGRLDPEVGALFMRAVEAANDALFKEEGREERNKTKKCCSQLDHRKESDQDETTPEQRRADAVGLLAERALAAGFGAGSETDDDIDAVISGSRAERYQVMLHVDAETLSQDGEPGQSELEDGTRVSAETSRRISCDSGLVKIAHSADGSVVGAGRRTRTVPPSVRRALEARDRGCRFPGCGLRFTDAHHVKHWADGGATTLKNLVLLCRRHHRAVHEGGAQVCIDANQQIVFFTPKGKALFSAPPRRLRRMEERVGDALSEASESDPGLRPGRTDARTPGKFPQSRAASTVVPATGSKGSSASPPSTAQAKLKPHAGAPRWSRDTYVPWEIEARAWEALDSG